MPVRMLEQYLDEQGVSYQTIHHEQTFTAQETAAVAHISGKELAKTVLVKVDGQMAMVVLPAPDFVSMDKLKTVTGAQKVELAGEKEFETRFPDVEAGAMPPFGNLWKLRVFVDQHLREDEEIAFSAGTHTELVKLRYADFERLVEPVVAQLAVRA